MPIHLNKSDDGKFVVIHTTGKLVEEDYKYLEPQLKRLSPDSKKPRVLLDMTGLHGWDAGAAWEEIKFDFKHFSDIDRIAVVGEKQWQHGMATLFSPFTKAATRYFDSADLTAANKWLSES